MPSASERRVNNIGQFGKGTLYDDFRDNPGATVAQRDSGIPPEDNLHAEYQTIRPSYYKSYGTPEITNNQLEFSPSDGGRMIAPCSQARGTWEWDVQWTGSPTQGQTSCAFLSPWDNSNHVQMIWRYNDTLLLNNSGGGTIVSSSATVDTAEHTIKTTYENGTFELFFDGASQGTGSAGVALGDQMLYLDVSVANGGIPDVQVNHTRIQASPWVV